MTNQSVSNYVQVNLTEEGSAPPSAGFSDPIFVTQSAVGSGSRIHGPFTSRQAVLDFGYAVGSTAELYAAAHFAQQPRARQLYLGRADAGDANMTASLAAIYAEDATKGYCWQIEDRTIAEQIMLGDWLETGGNRIGIVQTNDPSVLTGAGRQYTAQVGGTATDGDYDLIFTGFGLASPVTVTVTRSTTPATNDDLAAAIKAELDTQNLVAGDIEGLIAVNAVATDTVTFTMVDDLALGTITSSATSPGTLTVVLVDPDIADQFFLKQYKRCALVYHPTDTEYLDGAWASRCLSFDLDAKRGDWSFKTLALVPGTSFTDAQVTAMRDKNVNYFGPVAFTSGTISQAFTAQGWFPFGTAGAGRRIDHTTTLDLTKARLEEALAGVRLKEPTGIPYSDSGIQRFAVAAENVLQRLVQAEHLLGGFIVPVGQDREGTLTPAVFSPKLADTTSATRQARTLTMSGLAYLQQSIEKVIFGLETRV